MDPQPVEKLYSNGFLSDEEALARQDRGKHWYYQFGVVWEKDDFVLCWGGEKCRASPVPDCMRSTNSKVLEAVNAVLNTDEVLLKDQADVDATLEEGCE